MTMTFPQRLIDGYNAFAAGRLQREQNRFRELAERGQSPQIMVPRQSTRIGAPSQFRRTWDRTSPRSTFLTVK